MPRSMVYDIDVDVPAAQMYRYFSARGYWDSLVEFYRSRSARTEIAGFSSDGTGTDISFRHIMSAQDLPSVARRVVTGTFVVTRVQHFDPFDDQANRAIGRYSAQIPAPVEVTGDYLLCDTDSGSRMRLDSTCRARVPFIGGQIEQLVVDGLKLLLAQEGEFTTEWVASHH